MIFTHASAEAQLVQGCFGRWEAGSLPGQGEQHNVPEHAGLPQHASKFIADEREREQQAAVVGGWAGLCKDVYENVGRKVLQPHALCQTVCLPPVIHFHAGLARSTRTSQKVNTGLQVCDYTTAICKDRTVERLKDYHRDYNMHQNLQH